MNLRIRFQSLALMALAALALLSGCATLPDVSDDVVFPSETIAATGRSRRPVERLQTSAAQTQPTATRVPGLTGAMTPVNAEATASTPSVPLSPALAALHAREQARLEAMTQGLSQLSQYQAGTGGAAPSVSGHQAVEMLSDQVQVAQTQEGARASVTWSPLSQAQTSAAPADMQYEVRQLNQDELAQMEREATDRALSSMRAMIARAEVEEGKSIARWMDEEQLPPEALDELVQTAQVRRVDFGMEPDLANHFCEVEVEFDMKALEALR